jgi:cytochrome c-type protein NapB
MQNQYSSHHFYSIRAGGGQDMKCERVKILTLAVTLLAYGGLALSQESVDSLRGAKALDETSAAPQSKRWEPDRSPIPRDFIQQPPLIPHATKGYSINLKFNKCLTCHSWANYGESGATKISQGHFQDRDGNDLANVSASRYVCTQCHVGQRDVEPLVGNDFQSVEVLKDR